jgi:hypothetical protein
VLRQMPWRPLNRLLLLSAEMVYTADRSARLFR